MQTEKVRFQSSPASKQLELQIQIKVNFMNLLRLEQRPQYRQQESQGPGGIHTPGKYFAVPEHIQLAEHVVKIMRGFGQAAKQRHLPVDGIRTVGGRIEPAEPEPV